MEIPKSILIYIRNYACATRAITNSYNSKTGPFLNAFRSQPHPLLLKLIGDIADAMHNLDKGTAHFFKTAQEINKAWESQTTEPYFTDNPYAKELLPLPEDDL
jgi:hypothetical protein